MLPSRTEVIHQNSGLAKEGISPGRIQETKLLLRRSFNDGKWQDSRRDEHSAKLGLMEECHLSLMRNLLEIKYTHVEEASLV